MELRQLRYFAAVARHRHFGRAAQEVYITQSALSQQIARLEAELGVSLFSRTPKGVELTAAGMELNEHAGQILDQVDIARAAIDGHRGAVRGVARIAATPDDSSVVLRALVSFHRAHPEVELSLRHGSRDELVELLATKSVDVAVLGVDDKVPRLPSGAIVRTISEERLILVCSAEDELAGTTEASIETLRGVRVILPQRGTALRQLILRSCEAAGFSPLPLFETSDALTICTLAAEGFGRSAIPASWLRDDGLIPGVASFANPSPRYRVSLVHRDDVSPVGALLIEELIGFFERAKTREASEG